MSVDLLGDVEARFLDDNLLTNEDWANLGSYGDFSDLDLDIDPVLNPEDLLCQLPEDLKLGVKEDAFSQYNLPDSIAPDDLWMESSDSSDSGIHGVCVKTEPLSPVPSLESDVSLPESMTTEFEFHTDTNQTWNPGVVLKPDPQPVFVSSPPHTIVLTTSQIKSESLTNPVPTQSIHSILNSKMKIQPKPGNATQDGNSTGFNSSIHHDSSKALILTPAEFAQLSASGALTEGKLSPSCGSAQRVPTNGPNSPTTAVHPHTLTAYPDSAAPSQDGPVNKVLKRQQRMIKNRESASLSRKKKKEYVHTLEDRINSFTLENLKLKQENEMLKRQLGSLQSENERLKVLSGDPPAMPPSRAPRTRACLLAVAFMLTLNLAPWSAILVNDGGGLRGTAKEARAVHPGRHLLSVGEGEGPAGAGDWQGGVGWGAGSRDQGSLMKRIQHLLESEGHIPVNASHPGRRADCPTYYNSTESIRLAEKLAGWMWRHEQGQRRAKAPEAPPEAPRSSPPKQKPLADRLKGPRGRFSAQQLRKETPPYEVQAFHPEDLRRDFLSAIHQRNDTFYVLSFSTDYFLLPATAYNKTSRPKMSLLMPALVNLNETLQPPEGSVGMMQIDCEVFDTRLIHVQKMAPPNFFREHNQTRDGRQDRRGRH